MKKSLLLSLSLFMSYQLTAAALELSLNNHNYNDLLTLNINDTKNLPCKVTNNTEAESLIWYRGTQQVDIKPENSVNTSYVCITAVTAEDHGVSFTCLLKSNTSVKLSVQLNVPFNPNLTGDEQNTVEVGKDVQLTCGFKANPAAAMYWKRNGNVFTLPSRYSVYMTTDSLQLSITKAEKSDTANYTCVALTSDMNETKVFELIVEDRKPTLPVEAIVAAVVVGALIIAFGLFARRDKIIKCQKSRDDTAM